MRTVFHVVYIQIRLVLTSREDEVLVWVGALGSGHGQSGGDGGREARQRNFDVDLPAQKNVCC